MSHRPTLHPVTRAFLRARGWSRKDWRNARRGRIPGPHGSSFVVARRSCTPTLTKGQFAYLHSEAALMDAVLFGQTFCDHEGRRISPFDVYITADAAIRRFPHAR